MATMKNQLTAEAEEYVRRNFTTKTYREMVEHLGVSAYTVKMWSMEIGVGRGPGRKAAPRCQQGARRSRL